jgi:galactonate dehydratase
MKIVRLETLLANAGLRNYLFVRLHTDNGLTGVGEASLEWQELTVQTLLHEWVEHRILGRDPFNVEKVVGDMIRDQYQGGATVMTAISGVEIAMWDLIGKTCGQSVHRLIGGRVRDVLPAYANGWYGGRPDPAKFAAHARDVVARGYRAMKFDPFGTASGVLSADELEAAVAVVAAVRAAVGPRVALLIEYHGRLGATSAVEAIRALERFDPALSEEPVAPEKLELLAEVRSRTGATIAAGERLYQSADFARAFRLRAMDVVQFDVAHCGGIHVAKQLAAHAACYDVTIAPHCSVGPVAFAAALHVGASTRNLYLQESFSEFDVPWRADLVRGWNPVRDGVLEVPTAPGLGVELDDDVIKDHPYVHHAFPSLWDATWLDDFRQDGRDRR